MQYNYHFTILHGIKGLGLGFFLPPTTAATLPALPLGPAATSRRLILPSQGRPHPSRCPTATAGPLPWPSGVLLRSLWLSAATTPLVTDDSVVPPSRWPSPSPQIRPATETRRRSAWAPRRVTWPRFSHGAASSPRACWPPRTSCGTSARTTARTPALSRSSRATAPPGWTSRISREPLRLRPWRRLLGSSYSDRVRSLLTPADAASLVSSSRNSTLTSPVRPSWAPTPSRPPVAPATTALPRRLPPPTRRRSPPAPRRCPQPPRPAELSPYPRRVSIGYRGLHSRW
jgi:hypothetical protein